MGTEHAPLKAAPQKLKPNAPRGAPKSNPRPIGPLDAAGTVALLLRNATYEVEAAVVAKTATRKAGLIRAANAVVTTVRLIDHLTNAKSVDFVGIASDVAAAVVAIRRLETALASERLEGVRGELAMQRTLLADFVALAPTTGDVMDQIRRREIETMIRTGNVDEVTRTPIRKATPLSGGQHTALFRSAIAGATASIDAARAADIGPETCVPIAVQLAMAGDMAMAIAKPARHELTPSVTAISQRLDGVAQTLSMAPAQPWHLAYAQMFDAENSVLRVFGLPRKARPYSGTIDPQQAIEQLKKTTGTTPNPNGTTPSLAAKDPQTAVNLIAASTRHVFENQTQAIDDAKSNLEEPPPPKERSGWDTLLDIAVGVALGGVAGAIGGAIADKLKTSLEKGAKTAASSVATDLARIASEETRDKVYTETIDRLVKGGAIYRAVAVDGAKDAAKALFKDSMSVALKDKKSQGTNAAQPLNAFHQQQLAVMKAARQGAELQMIHFASALSHLDLDTLNELHEFIRSVVVPDAEKRQYDATIRAWLNLRARSAKELDPTQGPVHMPGRHVNGVLEARFAIDALQPRGHARPKSLVLRGGEPAAIRQLKKARHPLDKVGIHTRFTAEFEPTKHVSIDLGVGPDFNLLDPGIVDLQHLKVIAAGDPLLEAMSLAAMGGNYDHVSKADAIKVANQLLRNMAYISTAWVE